MTTKAVYLRLTSYTFVGGIHYYAILSLDGEKRELTKTLTPVDAATPNRREHGPLERIRNLLIKSGIRVYVENKQIVAVRITY